MSYKVLPKRHLAKTVSYRIVSTLIGFFAMWWATGDIRFGTAFGFMELIFKPFLYYTHERVWYKWFKFGLVEEKKKKSTPLTENNFKSQIKENTEPTQAPPPPPPPPTTGKKVLNYSSNR